MTRWQGQKIGRNEPCPCGSGRKFKRCHGGFHETPKAPTAAEIDAIIGRQEAREFLRQYQQGKGRPIISAEVGGQRIVAVGNRIHWSGNRSIKTFVDFLPGYLAGVMGESWGQAEIDKKNAGQRHQIVKWYQAWCEHQQKYATKPKGEIQDTPANGLTFSYLGLAYNLYLLDHNAEVQEYLVHRLKNPDSFYAAYYETHVAAWFILAGFTLALENEQDSTRTHTEFVATIDGRSYSVEAKTRQPGKAHLDVGNQLYAALRKEAKYSRVIFIDLNVGLDVNPKRFEQEVADSIRGREEKLKIAGDPAPPAFVFVTNQPSHLDLEAQQIPRMCLAVGFKIPDFGHGVSFPSLIDAHLANKNYADLVAVGVAFSNYRIPITFDGELPEFAFGQAERRFNVGQRYQISEDVSATLTQGLVVEQQKKAYLVFRTDDDKTPILTADLSDAELEAYRAHPETFFGQVTRQQHEAKNELELFEFFLEGYGQTPKERLLEFLENAPDIEVLKTRSAEELRMIYAERCVYGVLQNADKRKKS